MDELMIPAAGKVLSVNVGRTRDFDYEGRPAESAIWKSPVTERVAARGADPYVDEQADRSAHGGPDKAIYAYAPEDVPWCEQDRSTSEVGKLEEMSREMASKVNEHRRGRSR